MNCKINHLIIITGFALLSCRQAQDNKETVNSKSPKKANPNYEVTGIVDIAKDTVIKVKFYGSLITTDGGKSWMDVCKGLSAYEITLDNKNNLWLNASGGGIHEPKYANFYRSADWGKHWIKFSWNPGKFWPYKIISEPHHPLTVQTHEGKVYELTGNDPINDWKRTINSALISDGNKSIGSFTVDDYNSDSIKLTKRVNGHVAEVKLLDSVQSFTNIIKAGNIVYIAGSGAQKNGVYTKAYVYRYNTSNYSFSVWSTSAAYCNIYAGNSARVWAYTMHDLYLEDKGMFTKY